MRQNPCRLVLFLLAAALSVLAGCTSLLPQGRTQTGGGWQSFEDAKRAIEAIEPYVTQRADLTSAGIDPFTNSNVTILNYADLAQRFNVGAMLRPEEVDPGIRDCLRAGKNCTAYAIARRQVQRKRQGNFWLDILNFRRDTDVEGWSFNALIVMVDDMVVYTLYGGQPRIHEHEATRNPLGPLQGWGERRGQSLGL